MRPGSCALLILGIVSTASAAWAEGGTVAVVDLHVRGSEAAALSDYTRAVGRALAEDGWQVVDRDEVARRVRATLIVPVTRLQADRRNRIEELVRQGDQLVYTDPVAAVEVLNRARAELEVITQEGSSNSALRKELLKTSMLLARSHLDSGNTDKAQEILRDVIRVQGDGLEVTDREYHPKLVKLYRKTLAEMADVKEGVLAVDTIPRGCQSLLDGRALPGETPREYKGLYEGLHHLQVRCGDRESMIRRIRLDKARQAVSIDVEFEAALTVDGDRVGLVFESPAAADALASEFGGRLAALAGTDRVLLVGVSDPAGDPALRVTLVDPRAGGTDRMATAPARSGSVSSSAVKAVVADVAAGGAGDRPAGGASGRTPWYGNYWGWTMLGLGLAGIGVGGWQTAEYQEWKAEAQEPIPDGLTLAEIIDEYEWRVESADKANQARIGMIASYVAGGALVVGGVVAMVLTDRMFPASGAAGRDAPRFVVAPQPFVGGGGVTARLAF